MKRQKKKTLGKKLLVAMLSVMMAVTFIPTSLFVFAAEPDVTSAEAQDEIVQDDVQKEDVQDDVQTEEEVQTEPTEATEATEAVKEEPVKETEATQPKDAEQKEEAKDDEPKEMPAKHFTKDLDGVVVEVDTPKGTFDQKVDLVVAPINKGSMEYMASKFVLKKNGQDFDGMLAYDIHFENSNGKEVEPSKTVTVDLTVEKEALEGIAPEDFAADSVQVTHIGAKEADVVADTADKTDGKVDVAVDKEAIKSIKASFKINSFSPFTLTWGDPEQTATIHWGTYNENGEFEDFSSSTSIDTSTSSVDLAINHSGYYFVGVDYKASEDAAPVYAGDGVSALKKSGDSWKIGDITVADGSHIYVNYADKGDGSYTPPPAPTPEVLSPDTKKTVTKNADGTYTIQLDVEGKEDETVTQVGANVIVIMDITQSMTNNMPGGGTRMAAAKQALTTLINTLDPDTNNINFTAVNFGNSADYSNGVNWTTQRSAMENYVSNLPDSPSDLGTCWQAGLQGGIDRVGTAPAGNATYVIFVTDGNPNGWVNAQGRYQQQGSGQFVQAAYNAAVPNANTLAGISNLYGVFCGDADGYEHLDDLITNANGVDTINGSSTSAMESAFSNIAQTIVDNLGAGGVSVDDGVPSLSNVSANVTGGEAGGFEYYITPKGESQQEWDDAPGASYDQSNGVTWDLGEEGTLKDGWVYTLKFTVWPSQEAYDYIADLNNGLVDPPSDEELEAKGIEYKNGKYTLKTNTHLSTTFTDLQGNEYQQDYDAKSEAMDLPTERIKVKKIWNNSLDSREVKNAVYLGLEKDGEDYIKTSDEKIEVAPDGWESDYVYISMGFIKVKSDGSYEVLEPGHEYSVVEPDNLTYHWELTSEVYRPMMIKGEPVVLIKTDSPSGKDGEDYFTIDGNTYEVGDSEEFVLQAVNDRRSYLQIEKKVTGSGADKDDLFELTINITDPDEEDIWFSVYDDSETIVKEIETSATPEEGDTGYYYSGSGSDFTVKIKDGWTLRFLNLKTGTEYSVEEKEADLPDGYKLNKVETDVTDNSSETASQEAPEAGEVDGSKVTGTVNVPNCAFLVDFTNEYAETSIEITKKWEIGGGQSPDVSADAFKDCLSLLANGEATTDYDKNLTVKDNGDNTYTVKYTKLPKYIAGEKAEFKVQESSVPEGYELTSEDTAEDGGTITNKLQGGNLKITKTIEGLDNAPDGLKFDISGPNNYSKTVKYSDFTDGAYTLENVAPGEYSVKENGETVSGYTVETTYSESDTATVEADATAEINITNTYTEVKEPDVVSIDPPVTKKIKGDGPKKAETYTFQLEATNEAAESKMPAGANGSTMTTTIKGEGTTEFGVIEYTEPGVYEYQITEVAGSNPDCEYDDTVFAVRATVTEGDDGKLKVTREYFKLDGNEWVKTAEFVFTNTYTSEGEGTKTGDDTNLLTPIILLILAGLGIATIFRFRRREDDIL